MLKIALFLTLTSLTGLNAPAIILGGDEETKPPPSALLEEIELPKAETPEGIVKSYFEDIPVMVAIAQCESTFRHTDENGDVLRGEKNRSDIGIMQINERYHLEKAQKLDVDIYTLYGNLEFARYLYEKEGTKPWNASKKCWRG